MGVPEYLKTETAFGTITNTPMIVGRPSYGFATLDDGPDGERQVYIPAAIASAVGMGPAQLGQRVRVKYQTMVGDGDRRVAVEVLIVSDDMRMYEHALALSALLDDVGEGVDVRVGERDAEIDAILDILEERGCG